MPLLKVENIAYSVVVKEVIKKQFDILKNVSALFLIDSVVVILAVILFPYLWRD